MGGSGWKWVEEEEEEEGELKGFWMPGDSWKFSMDSVWLYFPIISSIVVVVVVVVVAVVG